MHKKKDNVSISDPPAKRRLNIYTAKIDQRRLLR